MRAIQNFSRFTLSASVIALGAAFATPAFAQTEQAQAAAQKQNDAVECSTITDPAEHQKCIDTQGDNALPQGGAAPANAIVVTGSRIPKPNFDTVEPAVVVNSAQLEARGFNTAAEALNELPTFGIPGNSPVGAGQQGAFGTGQSFVNFLGLGDQRTLVLVNGRRFISSNTSGLFGATSSGEQVDLGQINTKLIDRVETIAIGGAPIYGSDAIAGTINVILKKDYEGIDLDGQQGVSSRGDAANWRIRALAGHNFAGGRGNVTISGEYNKGNGLLWNDRKALRNEPFYDVCPDGSQFNQCLYNNQRLPAFGSETGTPLVGGALFGLDLPLSPDQDALVFAPGFSFGVQDAGGNDLFFSPGGDLVPLDYGTTPGGPDNALNTFNVIGGNGYDIGNVLQILSKTERYNANIIGHFDVTDHIRVHGEGWYAHSKSTQLRNQPIYNCGGCFGVAPGEPAGSLLINVNNPFLTAAQRATILDNIENNPLSDRNIFCTLSDPEDPDEIAANCGDARPEQDYFYLTRANTDLYSARATFSDTLYRIVGGVEGDFNALGGKWNWEFVGNYGRSKTVGKELQVNEQNFQNAVNAIDDGSGNAVCAPHTNSPFPTLSETCVPLNLFGTGRSSPAALDYILSKAGGSTANTQRVITADVSGPLFKLPGGDFSIAVGAETRHETSDFEPSAFYRGGPDPDPLVDENGDGDPTNDFVSFYQGVPIQPVKGKFTTKELFGEINADIISPNNSVPFIYSLDAQAAARYVHHSVAGGAVTWTVGSRYAPVRDLAFRGNFTHAIRAPSIQESTIPTSTFFSGATDPCDADNLGLGPDPATRAANCASGGALGVPTGYEQNTGVTFLQGIRGNPDLKNETSNAYSLGTVLTPRFIPHLNISADYVNVKLKDAIANFSATQVLNACYDSSDFPNNFFCSLIRRVPNPTNPQLQFVNTSFFNADQLQYKGIVGSLDYWLNTPFLGAGSKIGVNAQYQYLIELSSKSSSANAKSHNDGTLGYPRHSAVVNVNYTDDMLTVYTSFNYTGGVDQFVDTPGGTNEHQRLKSVIYTNAGLKFEINKKYRLFLDVDNVFDIGVPYPVPANGGSVTYFPGILGRYFRFGAGVHF
jgi:outer membrane receptor protein involved in Fe transport